MKARTPLRALAGALLVAILLLSGCGSPALRSPEGAVVVRDTTLERRIAEQLRVQGDARIFTLFAFLNLAGYDAENGAGGMHPVRRQVRARMQQVVPADLGARARAYYAAHAAAADTWSYSVVAMVTTGPPDFEWAREWQQELASTPPFEALADLPSFLRELYARAPVESLYAAVQPEQERYAKQYGDAVAREVAAVFRYARVGSGLPRAAGGGSTSTRS